MDKNQAEIMEQIGNLFIKLSRSFKEETKPEQTVTMPKTVAIPIPKTPPITAEASPKPKMPTPVPPIGSAPILSTVPPPASSFVELIQSAAWPNAVDENAMVKTEEDKYERAEGIIDLMIEHYAESLKFLDFGCGEGHIAKTILSQKPTLSVGYDIELPENQIVPWEESKDSLLLTTNLEKVREQGPYDIVLIYDVLDHTENPIEALKIVSELCAQKAKVFIRCHPWCSRHGGHLYQDLNKAYAHMFLTNDEVKTLTGKDAPFCQKVLFPQKTYINWFNQLDFVVRHENTDKNIIEPFFQTTSVITKHLEEIYKSTQFPRFQMEQSFLDFVLLKK